MSFPIQECTFHMTCIQWHQQSQTVMTSCKHVSIGIGKAEIDPIFARMHKV